MPSIIPGYEYDIFISYRHNDNLDGWVTDFVQNLEKELRSTIKEPLSIYFDKNSYDGLLETHHVEKSLEGKLKCLIFIPIISQTYCDLKSFAWQNEFCVFNRHAREEALGLDIKLKNGNVTSRLLPIKIHDLDTEDKLIIEVEIGTAFRAIEFIYKEPGVNRPLKISDDRFTNQNKTDYRNQINKVANAIKEITKGVSAQKDSIVVPGQKVINKTRAYKYSIFSITLILSLISGYFFIYKKSEKIEKYKDELTRADNYITESSRYGDDRYLLNAKEIVTNVLTRDSLNDRALYLMTLIEADDKTTREITTTRLLQHHPKSKYAFLVKAGISLEKNQSKTAIEDLDECIKLFPDDEETLKMLAFVHLSTKNYVKAWEVSKRYERVSNKPLHEILTLLYIDLGDFELAKKHFYLNRKANDFSCHDIEVLQRIYLCEGKYLQLERVTDSICSVTKCKDCSYWQLRSKIHVEKFQEAMDYLPDAIKVSSRIGLRLPALVLLKSGNPDSANAILKREMTYDEQQISDTTYRQSIPYYSLSSIYAMLGDNQRSLEYLRQYANRGFELGSEWYMAHDPLFKEALKNPEFLADFIQIAQQAQLKKTSIREEIRKLEGR